MAEISSEKQVTKPVVSRTVGIVLAIVIIVLLGWLFLGDKLDSQDSNGRPPVTHGKDNTSPDQAKQQGGTNNDTLPSPSGTGTGSTDHSLLGQ